MEGDGTIRVAVLRLGHRPGRDGRATTHVALTARALGADAVYLPTSAGEAVETARDVTDRFGGPFRVEAVESPLDILAHWDGTVVHLTMYGERLEAVAGELRAAPAPMLLVVGAEKVPFDVYETADRNVAVTNQPHSEIAALALCLDRLFEGAQFDTAWADARYRVEPAAAGKRVEELAEGADGDPEEKNL